MLFDDKKNKHLPLPLKLQQLGFYQQELRQFDPNKGPAILFLERYHFDFHLP